MLDYLHQHFENNTEKMNIRGSLGFFTTIGYSEQAFRHRQGHDFTTLKTYLSDILGAPPGVDQLWETFTYDTRYALREGQTQFSGSSGHIVFARSQVTLADRGIYYPTFFSALAITVLGQKQFSFSLAVQGKNCRAEDLDAVPFTNSPLLVSGTFTPVDNRLDVLLAQDIPVPTLRNLMTPPHETIGRRNLLAFSRKAGSSNDVVGAFLTHFATDAIIPSELNPFERFLKPHQPIIKFP